MKVKILNFQSSVNWLRLASVMQTKTIVADYEDEQEAIKSALETLKNGEIVALPTETVYGLGADALNETAVAKIFEAKERPSFDPLIIHLGQKTDIDRFVEIPAKLKKLVSQLTETFWPGPLTLVLQKKEIIPDIVTSGLATVGVRMSENRVMRSVAKELGNPIAAPSANRFGRISPTSASAVVEELDGRIPLIIDGGACNAGLESTIVSLEEGEKRHVIRILRAGPVTKEQLQKFGKVEQGPRVTDKPEAPGQLESHYAPSAQVLLFDSPKEFKPEEGKRYALLSYKGSRKNGYIDLYPWEEIAELSPGTGKLMEAALRLFFLLRELDRTGVDYIVAEPVSEKGLGVAIMDRLRRAAAKRPDA